MERLGGLDAAFLYFETPSMHMHVCGLLVLDPSTMPGGFAFDRIRQLLLERHPLMPSMSRRLAVAPFNLGRPYWVKDPDFDIDYHVRRIGVPGPGDDRQLAEVAGDIASRPLDRSRPLWEMWVIEGLANGNVAVMAKMHHSTIDGISGANMMVYLFDLDPAAPAPAVVDEAPAERMPREIELFGRGALETLARPVEIARLLPRTAVRLGATLVGLGRRRGQGITAPFTAPRTSFNAAITAHRTIAFVEVKLEDVKTVKDACGVKVNDVVTAVVSGALRRYLQGRGELPEKPLVAAIPVSVHDQMAGSEGATKISVMFSSLMTDVADPRQRLEAVARHNEQAKEVHKMVGADTLMQWAEHAAPNTFSLAARLYSSLRLSERHPVVHNLIVSNVPGPPVPLYMAGARLVGLYPLGPIMDGAGLNVTVLSNEDRIGFGFIACRELMPTLWDLADAVPEALAELIAAVAPDASSPEAPGDDAAEPTPVTVDASGSSQEP
ncbi:MAG TPA: wax ester/triacylglycerol synthase family O-acyltransferase [Acidimicrobiales bacterium]|nr:wax ester/triacylglycerol synthase family O-acyltransferase [Acidimicrobiales bacterium]